MADTHAKHASDARYLLVWGALIVLTVLTVLTARLETGAANLLIALGIACAKGGLVAWFFMHLSDTEGHNRLVFVVALVFVVVLILGVLADYGMRLPTALPPQWVPTVVPRE